MNINNQTTNTVFMVIPSNFDYNEETATNNKFQIKSGENNQTKALKESLNYIELLKKENINVITIKDTSNPITPDSVFPNNWFSTHSDKTLVLYPMYALNRRNERKKEFIDLITKEFKPKKILDLTSYENNNLFLEGTGSMVLDRIEKIVYACRSFRTSEKVIDDFCINLGYTSCIFDASDENNEPIYHTNVMMSIGTDYAVICEESIKDETQRKMVINSLLKTNKKIIKVSFEELRGFCCNILELRNKDNKRIIVMSDKAYHSFTKEHIAYFNSIATIIHPNLETIETNGGGSARCMISEIF